MPESADRHIDPFAEALGPLRFAHLSAGPLGYRDIGSGTPVIFLAGLVLSSGFWRGVVPELASEVRAVIPDLPLGAHTVPLQSDAFLSPSAIADLVIELLDDLELPEAVIVGNDVGGVVAKLIAIRQPERVRALVLTPCDCFDNFLPLLFRYLKLIAYLPGAMWLLSHSLRVPAIRRMPFAFGWLTKRSPDKATFDAYLRPIRVSRGIRRDTAKVFRATHPRYTADDGLGSFHGPALITWASEDRVFPYRHAERLAEILPSAQLIAIEDSYSYVPEDQPKQLARQLDRFLASLPNGGE